MKNADIDASYTIQYICRLSNRMDGTQIIRRASFASTDPKKYGLKFTRLNVENIIPYKVFNRIEDEKANIIVGGGKPQTKFSKVFYNVSTVRMNQNDVVYPDGHGPVFIKRGDAVYKFKFDKYNEMTDDTENVDLSGAYNYALSFTLDDDTTIELVPTYSANMNTTIGELEFKITRDQSTTLLAQTNNGYEILIKNPDGTGYVFYEGKYYKNDDTSKVEEAFKAASGADLQKENTSLRAQYESLQQAFNAISSRAGRWRNRRNSSESTSL